MTVSNVRTRRRAAWALGASLVAFGLLAAACGSDDSGSSAGTTAAGGGAATTAAGGAATTAAVHRDTRTPAASSCMGIEADTGSPWGPSKVLCAISGHTVIRAIYDSLTIVTDDGGRAVPRRVGRRRTPTTRSGPSRSARASRSTTARRSTAPRSSDNLTRHSKSFLTATVLADVATNVDGQPADRDPTTDRRRHDEASVGAVPAVPGRPIGIDRLARRG